MKARQSVEIYRRRVNRVMDYISDHLDEPLPLEKLARLAHFSPFHFHRVFRSVVGEPVHAFVKRLRLERAVFALTHRPRENLTAVALRHGFASSSDFSRAFKEAYGFSPRSYTRATFLEKSKIRQDLMANAGYGFGALPKPANPDRFRVQLGERPATRIGYVRVIGGYQPEISRRLTAHGDTCSIHGCLVAASSQRKARPWRSLAATRRRLKTGWNSTSTAACRCDRSGHADISPVALSFFPLGETR